MSQRLTQAKEYTQMETHGNGNITWTKEVHFIQVNNKIMKLHL